MTFSWDVLIPAYNAEDYIKAAVQSATNQAPTPSNIIICDDASTDRTAEIASGLSFVANIRNRQNLGVGSTRQVLLEAASSEWILYLDADDELLPNAGQIFYAAILANPSAVVHAFEETGVRTAESSAAAPLETDPPAEIDHKTLLARNPICSSATLVRREAVESVDGFTQARRLIDYCLWFRIARKYPTGILKYKTPVVRRLISSSTITGNVNAAVIEESRLLAREWAFSHPVVSIKSRVRMQLRLSSLWLRGLSRHVDYGKPGRDYVGPDELTGCWFVLNVLNLLKSRQGLKAYALLRKLKEVRHPGEAIRSSNRSST